MLDPVVLGARLADVRERIARAASRVGRDPHQIRLVAISKTFPSDAVRAAALAGQMEFGENKIQEALPKISQMADLDLRWHLVGHLQSNKAAKAASAFSVVHAIDGVPILRRLEAAAAGAGRQLDVLVQVDLAGETTKYGVAAAGVRPVIDAALECRALRLTGLMVLPPAVRNPEDARPYFSELARLRDGLARDGVPPDHLTELSMGMSHDFEVAVEEGATIVRVGSAIFGSRPAPS